MTTPPTSGPSDRQTAISRALGVAAAFDADREIAHRVAFLANYLRAANKTSYVLGISGGVDSLVAGRLTQLAVERLRSEGYACAFIAVRLPYGSQKDEQDASRAMDFVAADQRMTVDIKPAVDAQHAALVAAGLAYADAAAEDFVTGNIKARQRMIAQYAIAGARNGLVVGTDHAAEALMGFFTKHGDGAADVVPLNGLTKRRVRALGDALGAPQDLVMKVPTADLETLRPLRPDEDAFGVTYTQIDAFLEGLSVPDQVAEVLLRQYDATQHKRNPAAAPAPTPMQTT
ncbi:ammonia-dependent NAD(+) synthetase [Achromobacter aloeverae]|uniref:NH(3)-dependent NAD(+) synthetase n=1 Tax=Achromobacter aloeverae TaxID=1750518 RepID=A0A4Q1HQD9_9BURK|nr:ammonia-dependent NAD(+) synthetase [Achromobacter aloeverae]RXN93304.1 NAD(+) synthase [Achromobacter aloeverae]